ncbi:MAG TPA: thiamine phosphate synthase [Candidatus Krumholzibacteria bacterium]|nr:thiamine phosphate synthase [Candidatus Krumholzibacteria bacterium]
MTIGRLHVITDVSIQSRFSHDELAEMACQGGAQVIQLRDKSLSDETFLDVAQRVASICRGYEVTFIVNDRVEIAREVGAGVHLGQRDATIADARASLGPSAVIGMSAGTVESASAVEEAGAAYIGFGHIFPTTSKQKESLAVGVELLAAVAHDAHIPVIAIGGITETNAARVMASGAWGIAVIGAVCSADDPRAATQRLRAIVDRFAD